MQRARLFYTTWDSSRRAILSLALIAVFVTALVFGSGGRLALAQTPPAPGPVTDVKVDAVGATRVTLSWTPPAAGECPVTYYFIAMDPTGWRNMTLLPGQSDTGRRTTTVTELSKNAEHRWEIYATSENCACNVSSGWRAHRQSCAYYGAWSTPASITFRTLAEEPVPPKPVEPPPVSKKRPKRPTNLAVSGNGDSMTISWTAPENNEKRCALSSYSMYIQNRTDPLTSGFVAVKRHNISGTSANVSGLMSGHKYGVYVASYSTECRKYSTVVKTTYTHP